MHESILQIRNNGQSFDLSFPMVRFGVDFWYRMGYCGSVSGTSFDSCVNEVERYRNVGENDSENEEKKSDNEKDSSYTKRLKRKKERQQILGNIHTPFIKSMSAKLGIKNDNNQNDNQ